MYLYLPCSVQKCILNKIMILSTTIMQIHIADNPLDLGKAAAKRATELIKRAIEAQGRVHIILATGTSQFEMLKNLVQQDIPWQKVTMFHLDEYIGIDIMHPASFRKYLKERFIDKVGELSGYYLIDGDQGNPQEECDRLNEIISQHPIDVAMVGIGENAHLAFNDPPADFETEDPYIIVELDEACRNQQLGEGWFPDLESVPTQAISMSVNHILKSRHILVSVPDERKAAAVACTVRGEVSPMCPASKLQEHAQCDLYVDRFSASRI